MHQLFWNFTHLVVKVLKGFVKIATLWRFQAQNGGFMKS